MTTKLNSILVANKYSELLDFKNETEKIEHKSQFISLKILSEVEKVCDQKKILKKDLASKVGTSKSYISQLFNGSKKVNTEIMARFEEALDAVFDIRIKLNIESHSDYFARQIEENFQSQRLNSLKGTWYFCENRNNTEEIVKVLDEDKSKQVA